MLLRSTLRSRHYQPRARNRSNKLRTFHSRHLRKPSRRREKPKSRLREAGSFGIRKDVVVRIGVVDSRRGVRI